MPNGSGRGSFSPTPTVVTVAYPSSEFDLRRKRREPAPLGTQFSKTSLQRLADHAMPADSHGAHDDQAFDDFVATKAFAEPLAEPQQVIDCAGFQRRHRLASRRSGSPADRPRTRYLHHLLTPSRLITCSSHKDTDRHRHGIQGFTETVPRSAFFVYAPARWSDQRLRPRRVRESRRQPVRAWRGTSCPGPAWPAIAQAHAPRTRSRPRRARPCPPIRTNC